MNGILLSPFHIPLVASPLVFPMQFLRSPFLRSHDPIPPITLSWIPIHSLQQPFHPFYVCLKMLTRSKRTFKRGRLRAVYQDVINECKNREGKSRLKSLIRHEARRCFFVIMIEEQRR